MILRQTIIFTFFLLPSSLCHGMEISTSSTPPLLYSYWFPEKKFITFPAPHNDTVNRCFRGKFGYDIPDILIKETMYGKSVYKAVPTTYLLEKSSTCVIEIQDTYNPFIQQKIMGQTTPDLDHKKPHVVSTGKELSKRHDMAEKLILQKNREIKKNSDEILLLRAQKTLLAEEIALKKKAVHEIQQEIASKKELFIQRYKLIATQKKNAAALAAWHKPPLPKHNPHTNILQQKRFALKKLLQFNNLQTEKQLKEQFSDECHSTENNFLSGRINRYCTWQYTYYLNGKCINSLEFNTDNCESSESLSESSSQEESSCEYESSSESESYDEDISSADREDY